MSWRRSCRKRIKAADRRRHHVRCRAIPLMSARSDKGRMWCSAAISTAAHNPPPCATTLSLPVVERDGSSMALMPVIGRLRVLRQWGGVMDMSMDGSPIIDKTSNEGSISMAAGAMAASRRPPRRAGASPTPSRVTARHQFRLPPGPVRDRHDRRARRRDAPGIPALKAGALMRIACPRIAVNAATKNSSTSVPPIRFMSVCRPKSVASSMCPARRS